MNLTYTIAAISTPAGTGAIALVRLSGPDALAIADSVWQGCRLAEAKSHTAHLGTLLGADGSVLDEAVATVMHGPRSFTGEDTVELACHGSRYVQQQLLRSLVRAGARLAAPGEFSRRAFLNGRLDLAQAEGIADLISASSAAAHRLAISQMRGRFSSRLEELRNRLVEFASLIELELDFAEEDVEFADRERLTALATEVKRETDRLARSFEAGQVLKNGIPTAIVGAPNVGKSTLLNRLLGDDKAIVSDIPGTTRDAIEDTLDICGTTFRLVDTAGLRDTSDAIESLGIERTKAHIGKARVVLAMVDRTADAAKQTHQLLSTLREQGTEGKDIIFLLNKSDACLAEETEGSFSTGGSDNPSHAEGLGDFSPAGMVAEEARNLGMEIEVIEISAATGRGVEELEGALAKIAEGLAGEGDVMVTNARHQAELEAASEAMARVIEGLEAGLESDLIAQDIREATHHLGQITGTISSDTLLHSIFHNFCIGK